jgi:ribosome-binding ATPase
MKPAFLVRHSYEIMPPPPFTKGGQGGISCFVLPLRVKLVREKTMKLGIVGNARSGKTTIFNALTKRTGESVPSGGHAVPVLGVVSVADLRLDWLSRLFKPKKTTHAQVTYLDLQGLSGVLESHQEYMSLLLTHMRPVDAFLMVVRNFSDPSLGEPDVRRDLRELEDEFVLADLGTIERRLEKVSMEQKKGKKIFGSEKDLLESCLEILNLGKPLRARPEVACAPELRGFTFLSAKPLLIIVNNSDEDSELPEIAFDHAEAMVVNGKLEMELAQLPESEAAAFREDFGLDESALERVVARSLALLKLARFYTVGDDEARAWTVPGDLPALEAAGTVHTDMQKGFIRAEVVAYEDLRRAGDYASARKQGLVRLEGKTYPVKDGDLIHFRFNV